jgi:hypothetical protein
MGHSQLVATGCKCSHNYGHDADVEVAEAPSALQEDRVQRKAGPSLHLSLKNSWACNTMRLQSKHTCTCTTGQPNNLSLACAHDKTACCMHSMRLVDST